MKRKIIFATLTVVICIIIIIVIVLFRKNKKFEINSNNKYIFTTDLKYMTMQNDGGSHTNQYYQIDLENNSVTKCEDKYVGFKGYTYKGKVIKNIDLTYEDVNKIKNIFDKIIKDKENQKDISATNYMFYTLTINNDEDIIVNDYDLINQFLSIVDSDMVVNKSYMKVQEKSENIDINQNNDNMKINLKINDINLTATLLDNTSTRELIKRLSENDITINMNDYSKMEKVGNLGFNLPSNDENIKTEAGDLILYQGNSFVIYYENNNWSLTRLGKIDNITKEELKEILGTGDVTVILSLN